jgi:Domain of unknown function (DUF4382)
MGQVQTQSMPKKSRRRLALALILVVIIAGAVTGFLFYGPTSISLSIKDPPQTPYDSTVQAIYVTFTSIGVHTANAGNSSGWHTIGTSATVNLLTVLNVSSTLGRSSLPAGKYTELRFNVSQVIVTISGVNVTFSVPSGSFKVPILNGGFQAYGAITVNVELDLSFKDSEILSMNGHLTPVATARVV